MLTLYIQWERSCWMRTYVRGEASSLLSHFVNAPKNLQLRHTLSELNIIIILYLRQSIYFNNTCKTSVITAQKRQSVSPRNTSRLLLYREMTVIYCDNNTRCNNTLCCQM
jgi:hypothetical protein